MFFCPNCDNSFNITKSVSHQKGGKSISGGDKYEAVIKKIIDGETINENDVNWVELDELAKVTGYKKLKQKQKEKVYNTILELLPVDKKDLPKSDKTKKKQAFFICTNCGYNQPIKPRTVIFSRTSNDVSQSYISQDVRNMVHSDILRRTKKYICPNEKCESHKNIDKREAVSMRRNNTYHITMICEACQTVF